LGPFAATEVFRSIPTINVTNGARRPDGGADRRGRRAGFRPAATCPSHQVDASGVLSEDQPSAGNIPGSVAGINQTGVESPKVHERKAFC